MPSPGASAAPNSESSHPRRGSASESLSYLALAVMVVYAAVRNFCQAVNRPFWFDEISTFLMVRIQPWSKMWTALRHGADGYPPGFYLAERFAVVFASNENLAFRWLSIAAFSATLVCLFLLIRKRAGGAAGVVCAGILLSTMLFDYHSTEARPYSLVVACIAFALLCYQRAPAARWMIPMGLSLVLAESFHYYAFFSFLPFMVAESIRFLEKREWRWGIWLALGFGFLPLAVFWPLLAINKALYSAHFWSPPIWDVALNSYSIFFITSYFKSWLMVGAAAVFVLGTLLYVLRREDAAKVRQGQETSQNVPRKTSLQEPAMILTFLALPFLALIATKVAHGGLVAKYVLSSVLGFPLACGYVFSNCKRWRAPLVTASAVFLFAGLILPREKLIWTYDMRKFPSPAMAAESLVELAGHPDLPVVVSGAHEFMTLSHYASPAWKSRFVLVADGPEAVTNTGSDTADIQLSILADYTPIRVYDSRSFAAKYPVFLLYSSNGGQDAVWPPRWFKDDGYKLLPVAVEPPSGPSGLHHVFLVSRAQDEAQVRLAQR
jgi:4-amino-4-deoxy-L-arabinose transferase-like glycosyltransferase